MVQGSKVTAKARARAAQADLLRQRREHDELVLAATEAWYVAVDARVAAEEELAAAVAEQAKAMATLTGDLGLSVETSATLCGVSASEVRALVKQRNSDTSNEAAS